MDQADAKKKRQNLARTIGLREEKKRKLRGQRVNRGGKKQGRNRTKARHVGERIERNYPHVPSKMSAKK